MANTKLEPSLLEGKSGPAQKRKSTENGGGESSKKRKGGPKTWVNVVENLTAPAKPWNQSLNVNKKIAKIQILV